MIISTGNLLDDQQPRPTYSALVGTVSSGPRSRGAVHKKAVASKLRNGTVGRNGPADDFKVCFIFKHDTKREQFNVVSRTDPDCDISSI